MAASDSIGIAGTGSPGDPFTPFLDPLFARKTSDEIVNTSAALQNDNHLLLPLTANGTWFFESLLHVSYDATAEMRINWSIPAGTTIRWSSFSMAIISTVDAAEQGESFSGVGTDALFDWASADAGPPIAILLKGLVRTAGTAGNLQLRWAQRTSGATDLTVLTDSYLLAQKVA